ncbi:hypothetical protein RB195_000075 [Necator americanus]|uniref:Uncharacterized protein n=1 Tax=Necator americanus TaxID=51031 RepID=A0ABR1DAU6_NECAM
MGAEQSLEKLHKSREEIKPTDETLLVSNLNASASSSTVTTARELECNSKISEIPSTSASSTTTPETTTTTTTTLSAVETMLYPFREKVKHLPPNERKIKYEEEIRRLFKNPHESHILRLTPERIQLEKADVQNIPNAPLSWDPMQTTYDIGKGALSQRSFKRCNRSKADPWRRYGALRKLHEIGGTGCTPLNQTGVRVQQKFYNIAPGSNPPPPPPIPPITSIDEYGSYETLIAPKKRRSKNHLNEKKN